MKRVGIVIQSLRNGGAEKQSLLLARALHPYHDTYLVVVKGQDIHPKHQQVIERERLKVVPLFGSLPGKAWQFRNFVRQQHIDVLFSYLPYDVLLCGVVGRLSRVPHIYGGIRSTTHALHKWVLLKYMHNYLLDASICNAYASLEPLGAWKFRTAKLLVIGNGIEVPDTAIRRAPKSPLSIVTVGRFAAAKGYDTALRSVARLRRLCGSARPFIYKIIGYGSLEKAIRQWVDAWGLSDCVELVLDPADIAAHYRSADVYLCSSRIEGLSNTVMEAMAHALPVVATDVGDNAVLVRHGVNGYIAAREDDQALAAYLHRLLQSATQRCAFGQQSYHLMRQTYAFHAFQQRYLALLQRLAAT